MARFLPCLRDDYNAFNSGSVNGLVRERQAVPNEYDYIEKAKEQEAMTDQYYRPIEPTQPVYPNPYELTNPYGSIPLPPPPPLKRQLNWSLIVILVFACMVLVFAGIGVYFYHQNMVSQQVPKVDLNYTASEIYQDMIRASCMCMGAISSAVTVGGFITDSPGTSCYTNLLAATSSEVWADPLPNDPTASGDYNVGLWVYNNEKDAYNAYILAAQYKEIDGPGSPEYPNGQPSEVSHGRCLLLILQVGGQPWSGYQQAIDRYCI